MITQSEKLLRKTKNNYLLIIGIGLVMMRFPLFFIDTAHTPNDFFSNIYILIIATILIAPIFEEIAFRGVFTTSKTLKILSFIGIPLYIVILGKYYLFALYLLYLILYFTPKTPYVLIYVLNALLFALAHNILGGFSSYWVYPLVMLSHIGMAFILNWVVLNYSILHAMLIHLLHNAILIGIFVASLHFVDTTPQKHSIDNYTIEWNIEPILTSSYQKVISTPNHKKLNNVKTINLNQFITFSDSVKINPEYHFTTLSLEICSTDNQNITDQIFEKLLLEAGILIKTEQ